MRRIFLLLALPLFVACNGSDDDADDGVMFDLPQILPDNSPLCMSYRPDTTVGSTTTQTLLLTNNGREQLVISGGTIEDDARGVFDNVMIAPLTVGSRESAALQFRYKPSADGWDWANILVTSNAQNFPTLRVFLLALARPDPEPMGWDPGMKPDAAFNMGEEACEDDFKPRM